MSARCQNGTVRVVEHLEAAGPDTTSFLAEAEKQMVSMLDLDFCVFASVDPAAGLETSCDVFGIPADPAREMRLFELEWFSDDPLRYSDLAIAANPAGALRLTADPKHVKRFVEIGEPNGVHDEIRVACVADGDWWGTFTGFRFNGKAPFTPAEVARAGSLSAELARGFRRVFLHAAVQEPGNLDRPPGAFTVDYQGRFVTTTPTAEKWLNTVTEEQVSTVARSLAVGVRSRESMDLTIASDEGPLTFHGSPVKGSDEEISVIVEYPRPIRLTSLVIEAYELTPREREVTELVLRGLATKQIAGKLEISEYTVQDHLKSVFAKTGTVTRGELCALLYTSFYLKPKADGNSPSPYGYFLTE
jgi:DNA-binding CsgD family transcriptional regulator